ncbi:tonB-system energizer ExbB [Janthinobacterium fluminis]|uniref:Biopolymer transport protein ExbB n=1 Tax=Janthinobacterium fluminis TaxID=2987524 RepID=A0ABT5K2K5_9BURK|nr:tonB-system energizer ExbB [Janthinobacterium fluminis]MDC8759213.1 tonB-system energizer ExbB [Janthinobacterium fluminis]
MTMKLPRHALFLCLCLAATPALAAGAAPADMSPLAMFFAADRVVKSVLIGLLLASLASWVVLLVKGTALLQAQREAGRAVALLKQATSLPDAIARAASATRQALAQCLLNDVQQELALSHAGSSGATLKERAGFRQEQLIALKTREMTRGIGILATVGAVAPFVGLFGTVWGIMNSFIGIAVSKSTNLATVAPGIAEALLATALGLVAAIPAVVIYNLLTRGINHHKALVREAAAQVLLMLSRDLDVPQRLTPGA